jgi:hypothetical protein
MQKADIAILNLCERDYSFQDVKRGIVGALHQIEIVAFYLFG